MIIANPIPADKEANAEGINKAIEQALKEADEQGYTGAKNSPFVLKRINELTGGESSSSNVELIKNNAALGAKIAVELSQLKA